MTNENAPITKGEFMRLHNIGDPATLAQLVAEHDDEADHSNCIQPHRSIDGYVDCDGRPL